MGFSALRSRQVCHAPRRCALLAFVPMLLPMAAVIAQSNGYYERKEQGWFWHEVEILPEEPEETPASAPDAEPTAEQRPLSPAWLRAKLPEYRDRALENPTTENISAYFHLQRYAMDIAERFATAAQRVVLADGSLDENLRRPISTYGAQLVDDLARDETEKLAREIAAHVGVWYFYRSDCQYCQAQSPVLERMEKRIGLTVLPIALDGKPLPDGRFPQFVPNFGHAEQLKVTQSPTIYLVKLPDEFVLLTESLLTDDAFLERLVNVAHDAGWVSDDAFNATRPRKPSGIAPTAPLLTEEALNDPVKLVELLRARTER